MSIDELIVKVIASEKKRTNKERRELLVKAHVLNQDGYYDAKYFRKETVEKSKIQAQAS